jgi:hypothetical protein
MKLFAVKFIILTFAYGIKANKKPPRVRVLKAKLPYE